MKITDLPDRDRSILKSFLSLRRREARLRAELENYEHLAIGIVFAAGGTVRDRGTTLTAYHRENLNGPRPTLSKAIRVTN